MAITTIIGLIGEAIGFVMTQWNATKAEDLTPLGGYKIIGRFAKCPI